MSNSAYSYAIIYSNRARDKAKRYSNKAMKPEKKQKLRVRGDKPLEKMSEAASDGDTGDVAMPIQGALRYYNEPIQGIRSTMGVA